MTCKTIFVLQVSLQSREWWYVLRSCSPVLAVPQPSASSSLHPLLPRGAGLGFYNQEMWQLMTRSPSGEGEEGRGPACPGSSWS